MKLPRNKSLSGLSRVLRNNATLSEVVLWKYLQKKQALGFRFRRQIVIGKYIVDFYCPKLRLVIEIDGSSHDNKIEYDTKREQYLQSIGLTILHLDNSDVLHNIDSGLFAIETFIKHQMTKLNKNPE